MKASRSEWRQCAKLLQADNTRLRDENYLLRSEVEELNAIFRLQSKRMRKATKLWQKAHNKPNILPDLGDLLEWLMSQLPASPVGVADGIRLKAAVAGSLPTTTKKSDSRDDYMITLHVRVQHTKKDEMAGPCLVEFFTHAEQPAPREAHLMTFLLERFKTAMEEYGREFGTTAESVIGDSPVAKAAMENLRRKWTNNEEA